MVASGHGDTLFRVAFVGALCLIVAACHETAGGPPGPSLEAASRSVDIGENRDSVSPPPSVEQSEASPESADEQSAEVVTAAQESAVPATALPQEDIRADRKETSGLPTTSTEVVSVERKEPSPVRPKPEARPDSLLGFRRGDLLARLGTPDLLRREPPAEFWQFAGDWCVLHVYLYETTSSERYEVTHVELLPRGGLDAVPPGCFGRMLLDGWQKSG